MRCRYIARTFSTRGEPCDYRIHVTGGDVFDLPQRTAAGASLAPLVGALPHCRSCHMSPRLRVPAARSATRRAAADAVCNLEKKNPAIEAGLWMVRRGSRRANDRVTEGSAPGGPPCQVGGDLACGGQAIPDGTSAIHGDGGFNGRLTVLRPAPVRRRRLGPNLQLVASRCGAAGNCVGAFLKPIPL